jgi:WD40 repeat protein
MILLANDLHFFYPYVEDTSLLAQIKLQKYPTTYLFNAHHNTSNCLQTFIGHTDKVFSVNFSPDGKQIVSVSREICIWQLSPQSQPAWQLQHLWGSGYRLSFTLNQNRIIHT